MAFLIQEVGPQGEDALALLCEAVLEARALYPERTASPTPTRGIYLIGYLEEEPVACGALRPLNDTVVEVRRIYIVKHARRKVSVEPF